MIVSETHIAENFHEVASFSVLIVILMIKPRTSHRPVNTVSPNCTQPWASFPQSTGYVCVCWGVLGDYRALWEKAERGGGLVNDNNVRGIVIKRPATEPVGEGRETCVLSQRHLGMRTLEPVIRK